MSPHTEKRIVALGRRVDALTPMQKERIGDLLLGAAKSHPHQTYVAEFLEQLRFALETIQPTPRPTPFREEDCGGVLGADGNIYSDCDPGL